MGRHRHRLHPAFQLAALTVGVALWGCGGGGPVRLPPPRPIIVSSGERIRVDPARMDTI